MSPLYYYVVGQTYDQPPMLLESFDNKTDAYEFLKALDELREDGEYFYVTNHFPGDIQQL
jgi:hypothetical protein